MHCGRVSGCMCQYKSMLHLHRLTAAPLMALFSETNPLEFFPIFLNLGPLGTDIWENVLAERMPHPQRYTSPFRQTFLNLTSEYMRVQLEIRSFILNVFQKLYLLMHE